jgi:hypothetical protein
MLPLAVLVSRWLFGAIYNQHLHRPSPRNQLQAELLLNGGEKRRPRGIAARRIGQRGIWRSLELHVKAPARPV